jgi:hypothetical protein
MPHPERVFREAADELGVGAEQVRAERVDADVPQRAAMAGLTPPTMPEAAADPPSLPWFAACWWTCTPRWPGTGNGGDAFAHAPSSMPCP